MKEFVVPPLKTLQFPTPIYQLAEKIDRDSLDQGFEGFYSKKGRPAHPVRLTASLLMLKQMYDVSDENVVVRWVENLYWQFFSGTETFQWKFSIEPSDLTHFRNRIGKKVAERILKLSIDIHERKASDKEVLVDMFCFSWKWNFPVLS